MGGEKGIRPTLFSQGPARVFPTSPQGNKPEAQDRGKSRFTNAPGRPPGHERREHTSAQRECEQTLERIFLSVFCACSSLLFPRSHLFLLFLKRKEDPRQWRRARSAWAEGPDDIVGGSSFLFKKKRKKEMSYRELGDHSGTKDWVDALIKDCVEQEHATTKAPECPLGVSPVCTSNEVDPEGSSMTTL